MLSGRLFGKTILLLERALDFRSKRHALIAANIANIDTPNYRPKEISFERELKTALSSALPLTRTHAGHFPTGENVAITATMGETTLSHTLKRGMDTVDLDREMANLAQNNLMYLAALRILSQKFEGLKAVLREGGR